MNRTDSPPLIIPQWPAPANVKAYSTTRQGGVSNGKYSSFNLGLHVGDSTEKVQINRSLLPDFKQIVWLNQVHGTRVIELEKNSSSNQRADASITTQKQVACAVMTADCLPLLLCHKQAKAVAAVHCGWRGLAAGIIDHTLGKLPDTPANYLAWLGPAIGSQAFEVGKEVLNHFPAQQAAFSRGKQTGKYLADIYALASIQLQQLGLNDIYGGEYCTFSQADRFFSYRRDGQTGRMASVICIAN
jgi:polyphenol oxidase